MTGHHRQLSKAEAARVVAQRKKYIVGVVAVAMPFAMIFCLYPTLSSSPYTVRTAGYLIGSSSSSRPAIDRNNNAQYLKLEEDKESISKSHVQKKRKERAVHNAHGPGSFLEEGSADVLEDEIDHHHSSRNVPFSTKSGDGALEPKLKKTDKKQRIAVPADDKVAGKAGSSDSMLLPDDDLLDVHDSNDGDQLNQPKKTRKRQHTVLRRKTSATCDFSNGKWISDSKGLLYTNRTCPWVKHDNSCKIERGEESKNKYWTWKPDECALERFEAKSFLRVLQHKVIAFVGERMAKSQMQSLLCLLGQAEPPELVYDDTSNQSASWRFPGANATVMLVWSAHLVQERRDYIAGAAEGLKKLSLDGLDEAWAALSPGLDVVVLEVGHRFMEPASYVVKNKVVGCHACNSGVKEISIYSAYRAAVRTAIKGMGSLPGFTGTTVFQTLSVADSAKHKRMKDVVQGEIEKAHLKGIPNGSALELLDLALVQQGNASSPSPFPTGFLCFPGPPDTWNQFLMHILLNPTLYTSE